MLESPHPERALVHEKPRRSVICGGVENGDGMNNAGTVEACKSDPLQIMEKPAFEVHGRDGHVWKIYPNGMTEGFLDDHWIINRIPTMFRLVGALGLDAVDERIPSYPIPDDSIT